MKLNQQGLSLPEILISLGVMGAIGVGVGALITQSAKKKTEMDQRMNRMSIEKRIETYFYSDTGCDALKGKKIGDSIVLDPDKFPKKVGKTEVAQLRIADFIPTDEKGVHGVAKVTLTLLEKGLPKNAEGSGQGYGQGNGDAPGGTSKVSTTNDKNFIRDFPVPVNVKSVGGSLVIEDCRMNHTQAFSDIVKRVCEGTFGSMTAGLSCAEAVAQVETKIIKEICADIYGSKSAQFNADYCNVTQIHSNQNCGPGVFMGFDMQGNKMCKPLPVNGATPSKTPPETPPKTPSGCSAWSAWLPDPAETCSDKQVAQTRTCLDSGSSETQSQSVAGTKSCGASCTLNRPLAWEEESKKGITTCMEAEAPDLPMKNWESYQAIATQCTGGYNCSGSYNVQCQNGVIVFITGSCTIGKTCPADTVYCQGAPAASGGALYKWGYKKYLTGACKETKVQVGSYHFTGSELASGVKEGCPPPFGDSNVE